MTSGRDEYLERTKKHIDYDKENERRVWWLNNTGGDAANNLTVRDYFAAKVLQVVVGEIDTDLYASRETREALAADAYAFADAMLEERNK